ncbi:MAG: O-antigen ligase family protein, partial [Planctomycetota bacterium]|nr:O-antigen ligase family protein [Planctomycetota bacterium]
DPAAALAQVGMQPGTPAAIAFAYRARDRAVLGPIGMATPFAGLMVLLASAAVGLAVQKIAASRRERRAWLPTRGQGEIHPPTLAAWLTLPLALTAAVAIPLTESKGGMIAGIVSLAGMAILWRTRRALAEHWRRNLAVLAGVVLAGATVLVAWGVRHDSLPSRTMTYRWHYWTGALETLLERPYLGTGAGNFGTLYLKHRRFGADEEVKSPHNVVVEALSVYGVAGGVLYLTILFGMLAAACRAAPEEEGALPARATGSPPAGWTIAAAATAAALAKLLAGGIPLMGKEWTGAVAFATLPAALLAVTLATAWWAGARFRARAAAPGPWGRVALVCGLFAFVLDNMVCYGIWRPGIGTVFWGTAGAAVAWAGASRWVPFAAAVAGWGAAFVVLYVPVCRRAGLAEEAVAALNARDYRQAARSAAAAARLDPLDAIAAYEAAHACQLARDGQALAWAQQAVERNPFESGYYRTLADLEYERDNAGRTGGQTIASFRVRVAWEMAVRLNPNGIRLLLDHAKFLAEAGSGDACRQTLDRVEALDAALFEESPDRLTTQDRRDIEAMRLRYP